MGGLLICSSFKINLLGWRITRQYLWWVARHPSNIKRVETWGKQK